MSLHSRTIIPTTEVRRIFGVRQVFHETSWPRLPELLTRYLTTVDQVTELTEHAECLRNSTPMDRDS